MKVGSGEWIKEIAKSKKCSFCKSISDSSTNCPNCGAPKELLKCPLEKKLK